MSGEQLYLENSHIWRIIRCPIGPKPVLLAAPNRTLCLENSHGEQLCLENGHIWRSHVWRIIGCPIGPK